MSTIALISFKSTTDSWLKSHLETSLDGRHRLIRKKQQPFGITAFLAVRISARKLKLIGSDVKTWILSIVSTFDPKEKGTLPKQGRLHVDCAKLGHLVTPMCQAETCSRTGSF
jgi:hypothetical protein